MSEDIDVDSLSFNGGPEIDRAGLPMIHLRPVEGNITYSILDMIEADLDFYEKVSLVFLLYENAHLALQCLWKESRKLQGSRSENLLQCGIFSDWARSARLVDWEERFLEALSIIQNFYVVERLGYDRHDIVQRFLPENSDTAVNVDHTRKKLYIFCEKLSSVMEHNLIGRVEDDIGSDRTPLFIQGDFKCMEIFLLYLMSDRHILHHNGVKMITKHLKAMGKMALCDFLEPLSARHEIPQDLRSSNELSDDDRSLQDNNRSPSIVSTSGPCEFVATECDNLSYRIIDHKNIGVCVIINQKRFYCDSRNKDPPKQPLDDRTGTDVDRDRLIEAFGNFGFTVHIWKDLTHQNLIEAIETATKTLVKDHHSCFVLCILSHGTRGAVYGVDSVPVEIDEIHRKIQGRECPQLINKLKIVIIQACQGYEEQEALSPLQPDEDLASDGGRKTVVKAPERSDSLLLTSTIPGYVSYRDRLRGTWFIQSLSKHLLSSTKRGGADVGSVFLKVSNEVASKISPKKKVMQPISISTLRRTPYLPCQPAAQKTVAILMIKRIVFYGLLKEYLTNEYVNKFSPS